MHSVLPHHCPSPSPRLRKAIAAAQFHRLGVGAALSKHPRGHACRILAARGAVDTGDHLSDFTWHTAFCHEMRTRTSSGRTQLVKSKLNKQIGLAGGVHLYSQACGFRDLFLHFGRVIQAGAQGCLPQRSRSHWTSLQC